MDLLEQYGFVIGIRHYPRQYLSLRCSKGPVQKQSGKESVLLQ